MNTFFKKYRFYIISLGAFLVWMTFFDQSNFTAIYKVNAKVNEYEKELIYYQEQLENVERESDEVLGDKDALEKFAREKYLMKKEGETIFVFTDKDGNYLEN